MVDMELAIRTVSARSYADDVHDSGCELLRVIESHAGHITLLRVFVQQYMELDTRSSSLFTLDIII